MGKANASNEIPNGQVRPLLAQQMSEEELLQSVKEAGWRFSWIVYHTWRSDHSAAGFPDLVLVRRERLLFVELKREGKIPSPAQERWLEALVGAGAQTRVWRPLDWLEGRIEEDLR